MSSQRTKELFIRYYEQTASEAEISELMHLLHTHADDSELSEWLDNKWKTLSIADGSFSHQDGQHLLQTILGEKEPGKVRFITPFKWAAAAAIILALGAGIFFMTHQQRSIPPAAVAQTIPPGTNKAILTLADGSKVALDSKGHQQLLQGGTTIHQQHGQLQYISGNENGQLSYNTLSTPRGGQFQITLPDGTKVWLNAASSITYPTAFNGNDRHIRITGEAYFEVAPDPHRPFHVTINNTTELAVLGTHFDIYAYTDEPYAYATLLEGSVKISNNNSTVQLKPGQQAKANGSQTLTVSDNINTDQVLAWKNGTFNFDNTDLPSILRQLSRWYDVDIVYEGKMPDRRFGGEMQRSLQLDQVLRILGTMGVKFRIKEHQIIVQP